ncbi:MAG: WD40 repeat domain-containing protein [Phycisphaerales bacterium]|nr:WD40 repeat domain-containing protein [Phycisphaerales bacterium]
MNRSVLGFVVCLTATITGPGCGDLRILELGSASGFAYHGLALSNDGSRLVSAGGLIDVWDTKSRRRLWSRSCIKKSLTDGVSFAQNDEVLIARWNRKSMDDRTVVLKLRVSDGLELERFELAEHELIYAISPDGQTAFRWTGGAGYLWDLITRERIGSAWPMSWPRNCAFSTNGERVAVQNDDDGEIIVLDSRGDRRATIPLSDKARLVGADAEAVYVQDLRRNVYAVSERHPEFTEPVVRGCHAFALMPSGRRCASIESGGLLVVRNLETGKVLHWGRLPAPMAYTRWQIVVSNDDVIAISSVPSTTYPPPLRTFLGYARIPPPGSE